MANRPAAALVLREGDREELGLLVRSSTGTIAAIWRQAGVQPWRAETFKFSTLSQPPGGEAVRPVASPPTQDIHDRTSGLPLVSIDPLVDADEVVVGSCVVVGGRRAHA